jgi:16S rRNA (guanine527-N7)-methyltransferase
MFSSQKKSQFIKTCSSFRLDITKEMVSRFETYTSLLLEWNKKIHLVSKGDAKGDRILRHIIDSLLIFKVVEIPISANIMDLGAGAGFPSIPIRIIREDVHLTLVESTHKKTLFLRKLVEVLRFSHVRILDERAEALARNSDLLGKFDLVTAKALGKLQDAVELSFPFMRVGGLLVLYKGKAAESEIKKTQLPINSRTRDVTEVKIPEENLVRWLIVIEKTG